jgi:hypothetical protein
MESIIQGGVCSHNHTSVKLCLSLDSPVVNVSHQWSHTLCSLLHLVFLLSSVSSGSLHVVACVTALLDQVISSVEEHMHVQLSMVALGCSCSLL